jgi:hypothetical protein
MARHPISTSSAVDPTTLDVAAFEPWSAAGGLRLAGPRVRDGPSDLLSPEQPIAGGDDLHRHLIGILRSQGTTPPAEPYDLVADRRLLLTLAAAVIVIAGLRAVGDIVGPLMLAVS